MVSTKNLSSQEKTKDKSKSPSPKPFKEPEGMVTVDLNSGDYNRLSEEPTDNPKCKHKHQLLKYWIRVFCMIGVMFIGISSFIFIMLIDKEYNFFNKPPKQMIYKQVSTYPLQLNSHLRTQEETDKLSFSTTELYAESFKERLTSGTYLQDFEKQLASCKAKKTLEDCCDVFASETDLIELKEFCTVNDILNILLEHENSIRMKRNAPRELSGFAHQQPSKRGELLPLVKDFSEHIVKSELPAIYDQVNNYMQFPQNRDYYDYRSVDNFEGHQRYRNNYESENDYNNVDQYQNDLDYQNQETYMLPESYYPIHEISQQPVSNGNLNNQAYLYAPVSHGHNARQSFTSNDDALKNIVQEKTDIEKKNNYPLNVKSSVDVTGIRGRNKSLEINLKNAVIDLYNSKNISYRPLPHKINSPTLNTLVSAIPNERGPELHLRSHEKHIITSSTDPILNIPTKDLDRGTNLNQNNSVLFTTKPAPVDLSKYTRGSVERSGSNEGNSSSVNIAASVEDADAYHKSHRNSASSLFFNPPPTDQNKRITHESNISSFTLNRASTVTVATDINQHPVQLESNTSLFALYPDSTETDPNQRPVLNVSNISSFSFDPTSTKRDPDQNQKSQEGNFFSLTPNPSLGKIDPNQRLISQTDNMAFTFIPSSFITYPDEQLKSQGVNLSLLTLNTTSAVTDSNEHPMSQTNIPSLTLNSYSSVTDPDQLQKSKVDNPSLFKLNPVSTVIDPSQRATPPEENNSSLTFNSTSISTELDLHSHSQEGNISLFTLNSASTETDAKQHPISHEKNISTLKLIDPALSVTDPNQRPISPTSSVSSFTFNSVPFITDADQHPKSQALTDLNQDLISHENVSSFTLNPSVSLAATDQHRKSQDGNPSSFTFNPVLNVTNRNQRPISHGDNTSSFTFSPISTVTNPNERLISNKGNISSIILNPLSVVTNNDQHSKLENSVVIDPNQSPITEQNQRAFSHKDKHFSSTFNLSSIATNPDLHLKTLNRSHPTITLKQDSVITHPRQSLVSQEDTIVLMPTNPTSILRDRNSTVSTHEEISKLFTTVFPVIGSLNEESMRPDKDKSPSFTKNRVSTIRSTDQRSNASSDANNRSHSSLSPTTISPQMNSHEARLISKSQKHKGNQLRENPADGGFRSKNKMDTFSTVSEDIQSNHQSVANPCFYPYMGYPSPYRVGSPYDGDQMMRIVPSTQSNKIQQSMYVLNPPMYYSYPQQTPFIPNYYQPAIHQPSSYSSSIHASGPGGQYYLCNPISASNNNIAGLQGVEIRRESLNLQDLVENMEAEEPKNLTKTSGLLCSIGEQACADNKKCINNRLVCDNEVQCADGSDESFCSCKERVGKLRTCDGYCDCPDCNDELGCFGCQVDEFSCDDWSRFRRSTCIPAEHRCDNIRQCEVTGKDEEDCSLLTDNLRNFSFNKVSNSVGFLHRNFKGKWYPTCFGTEIWAAEVCKAEAGPSIVAPQIHMVLNKDKYDGDYINILPNNEVSLVSTCVQDRAAFVQCPPMFCGLRMLTKNPYRPQEVDTSIEDIINEMERSHILKLSIPKTELVGNDSEVVGISRVVGGKPSQPGAWPWLVAIYKNGIFHCGGVLINELWVATAAHCLDRYWLFYYEVQAGILRRFSFSPTDQTRWVTVAIPHEKYNKIDLSHDIALVKLASPVRYNRNVRPICLPSETTAGRDFLQGPAPGTVCTTVGWGATVEHGADPDHMREVEVPIINHCKNKEDMDSNEICAGLSEGGKDACQGDSGGPFMCRNPNNPSQWYLAGIVSHGEGCARPREPGVYTRVSKYIGWIAENLKDTKFRLRIPLQKCPGYICKVTNRCLPKKRRCDKIVDCLLADDEEDCEHHPIGIFKHNKRTHGVVWPKRPEDVPKSNSRPDLVEDLIDNFIPQILDGHAIAFDQIEGMGFRSSDLNKNDTRSANSFGFSDFYFKCKILLQITPKNKRCNRVLDCEDGTDEVDCKCVDYIRNIDPKSVCDGVTDCADGSDESSCVKCSSLEYHCRRNETCIPLSKRCNGEYDCLSKEDEIDCYALTDGSTLNLDSDLRPDLTTSGVITINRFGVWKPFCNANMSNSEASIATNVCNLLGFEEYIAYHKYQVADKELKVTMDGFQVKNGSEGDWESVTCSGLYVICSNITLHSTVHDIKKPNTSGNTSDNSSINSDQELYKLPWFAAIYSDGEYRCMGTVLDATRIVTSINCFKGITMLKSHYVVALLGKGKFGLSVRGPYEKILRIVKSEVIENTDIIILGTERNITFNRYVRPANLEARRDGHRIEKCITAGIDEGTSEFVRLTPLKSCTVGYRCFENKKMKECKNDNTTSWSGVIVCDSGSGWYPAAVYHEENGTCDLAHPTKKYTSIKFHKNKIIKALQGNTISYTDKPFCKGILCNLGQCITKNKICDGIPDCTNAEDETPERCYEKEHACHLTNNCECPTTHLKCNNQKCLSKSVFCDRTYDCADQEDEPTFCTCKNYLKLANPDKICDGVLNCLDKTDEDPEYCPCRPGSFVCTKSSKCVPQEMVCDGYKDCPNGDDESFCFSLKAENSERTNAGEVMTRTAGVWHSGCFDLNYTTIKLEAICENLGFASGSATQLSPPRSGTTINALRPETDTFDVVWLRRTPGNMFRLRIRTGNDPYVRFKKDESCYRLFIACI